MCSKCRKQHEREYDIRRGSPAERGYDGQWGKVSEYVRRIEPMCRRCRDALAQMVDHIIPIKQGGERLALDNLQPLCNSCHNKKTREDEIKYGKQEHGKINEKPSEQW